MLVKYLALIKKPGGGDGSIGEPVLYGVDPVGIGEIVDAGTNDTKDEHYESDKQKRYPESNGHENAYLFIDASLQQKAKATKSGLCYIQKKTIIMKVL